MLRAALLFVAVVCAAADVARAQEWRAHGVPLFMSASSPLGHQGFVRVINHSDEAGEVLIDAVDDAGVAYAPVTLAIGAGEAVHINSEDMEEGNGAKGLLGGIGAGTGNWRLRLRSRLDIEVLAYNRTGDGLLAGLHDLVPRRVVRRPGGSGEAMGHRVAIFNPASNVNQVSRLRVINPGEESAEVSIEGIDDEGRSPGTAVGFTLPGGASRTVTSRDLESGQGEGLAGTLDDGRGKWQLVVSADEPVEVMSLLTSPTGHLTNLSTEPDRGEQGPDTHHVPLFASVANPHGYQGFARVINGSGQDGEVVVEAIDDAGVEYAPVRFPIAAGQSVHFNSDDLELGNDAKGLSSGIGAGTGDWRLTLRSDLDIEVLAYNRAHDGLLTTLHDVVPYTEVSPPGGRAAQEGYYAATFNPASNVNQVSRLRIINPGAQSASVFIEGFDDAGASPGSGVRLTVPGGAARTLSSRALESGQWAGERDIEGMLGDGRGKWRLLVTSEQALEVMSLLASPTGHLVNLSTVAPAGEVVPPPVVAAHAAMEVTGRTTASVGTAVTLSVTKGGEHDVPIERYVWHFSDGQRDSGEEVSVRFAEAGVHEVTVTAMSGTDVVAQARGAVAVFDAAAGANPGFVGIPTLFGDVNQDGRFGPADLELVEARRQELDEEAIEAGDLDLSGAVDERDVELMRQALDSGAALPSAILDEFAYPGGVVAMVSPALQDPDTDIEVFVDGTPSPRVMRAILGYATFAVPASLTGTDAEVDVVVESDGMVVERLRLLLRPLPDKPAVSAKEDVLAFLGELSALVAVQEEAGAAFLEYNGGLTDDEVATLLGGAKAAAEQLKLATAALETALNGEGGEELAALLQAGLYANGLAEFREGIDSTREKRTALSDAASGSRLRATSAVDRSVSRVCDEYVPAICALQKASRKVSFATDVATGMCAIAGAGTAVTTLVTLNPAAVAALSYVGKACLPLYAGIRVVQILGLVINAIVLDMELAADKSVLEEDESATITAKVTFEGLQKLCRSVATTDYSGRIVTEIVKGLTLAVLRKSDDFAFITGLLKKVSSEKFVDKILEEGVGKALTVTGLGHLLKKAVGGFCSLAALGQSDRDIRLGVTANADEFGLTATNGGVLTANEDGTGTFSLACPAGFNGTIKVEGKKNLCGKDRKDNVTVTCRNECTGAPEDEVYIPDPGLRSAVEEALGKTAGTPISRSDMARMSILHAEGRGIGNLAGLECATGLWTAELFDNQISDVSPLSDLTTLINLFLDGNQISDVSPLSGMTALVLLSLGQNQISDVSPLSDLTALGSLHLDDNQISSVSALSGLTALSSLGLRNNQISDVSPLAGLTALEYGLILSGNQISDVSALSGMTALKNLGLGNNQIANVSALAGMTALERLDLEHNQISSVSPLSGMTALEKLRLNNNRISSVSALAGMTALDWAILSDNQISNVSPLAGLTALETLLLSDNRISNIGPLVSNAGLGRGDFLGLGNNPLSERSCLTHVPTLERRGVQVSYSGCHRYY